MSVKKEFNSFDDNSFAYYLKDLRKLPLLTHEQEIEYAQKAAAGDKIAKEKIITSNLRFVIQVAKKYQNRGIDIEDLISEGNIGLINAIEHYDVSKGYHFISYAVWWIRQSILRAINEKSRMIRLPANRENELTQIENTRRGLNHNQTEEEEIIEIADMLNMDEAHVRELLCVSREMLSLDTPVCGVSDSSVLSDLIEDTSSESPESAAVYNCMKDDINEVVDSLSDREAAILKYRYGLNGRKAMSLKECGAEFNLTKERIRQIEKRAIKRLQHPVRMSRLQSYVA